MAAAKKTVVLRLDPDRRDDIVKRLGYLRCWLQGYLAGGGQHGPHDVDQLRQLQQLLRDAK